MVVGKVLTASPLDYNFSFSFRSVLGNPVILLPLYLLLSAELTNMCPSNAFYLGEKKILLISGISWERREVNRCNEHEECKVDRPVFLIGNVYCENVS